MACVIRWMCCVPLLVALILCIAAGTPRQHRERGQPATPRPVTVTVTQTDGKIVRGTIESADPEHVMIKPSPKDEPIRIAWSDITRVSDGLTREKAIEQYKKQHPEHICKDCGGDGLAADATCRGTGFDQAKLTTCDECGGGGAIADCTNKRCDNGKVDCPRPCLKLTVGQWKTKDGKKWRDFRGRDGGVLSISDGHLGELVEMENGTPTNKGKCPTCDGTTKVSCETCGGASLITCPKCFFEGKTGPACPSCKDGQIQCKSCGGAGVKKG